MATEPANVIDITAEIVGERRQEWRDGFDVGVKQGTARVLNSDALTQLALGLKVHKAFNEAMAEAAEQREKLIAHWKDEARWWQEECKRVSDEYTAFVKQVARMVGK